MISNCDCRSAAFLMWLIREEKESLTRINNRIENYSPKKETGTRMIARAWGFIIIHPISRNDNDERKKIKINKKKEGKRIGGDLHSIVDAGHCCSSTRHQPQYHQYIGTLEGVLALEWKRGEAISKAAQTHTTNSRHTPMSVPFLFFLPGCLRAYIAGAVLCWAVLSVCKGENVCLALTCAQAPEFGYIV